MRSAGRDILDHNPNADLITEMAIPLDPIADYSPKTALTVMQIKDFKYAAAMMQHVEVT